MTTSNSPSTIPVQDAGKVERDFHYKYTVQKGYFLQSEDSTDDQNFDFSKDDLGLIGRSYNDEDERDSQWKRFEQHVRRLEQEKGQGGSYKVLFLGRHGQGWHNVAETKYGTQAWDCYYSALDGADGMTWADAKLTRLGQQQARDVNKLWKEQLLKGIPPPETYYVSPLTRTIETADLSFNGLQLPDDKPYNPFVKEFLREALGVHTCDRRSALSHIRATFSHLTFEPGFSDPDIYWEKDYREPRSARRYRLATLLDDIFSSDPNIFLSLTSHSGAIGSILEVIGHRGFALETGGVIPVFVKAECVKGKRKVPPKEPSDAPPLCDSPPT